MSGITIVHYLNQFFGGIGGEDLAGVPVQIRDGPVGPGNVLQRALGEAGAVVATIICGDNYCVEQRDQASTQIQEALRQFKPDVVAAGPAFDSGRYGIACATVCMLAQEIGILAVTGMHKENPGFSTYRRDLICVDSGRSVTEMASVVQRMATLARTLGNHEPLGSAEEEGYLPRGIRQPVTREKTGAERAVDMVVARTTDQPYVSEIPIFAYERVAPAPPIDDLAKTKVAVVTSGGLVPRGNPDHLVSGFAEQYFEYPIADLLTLDVGEWESVHGGYSPQAVNTRNPQFVVPLDVLRDLEAEKAIGSLHPSYFVTVGNGTAVTDSKRMGAQIAEKLLAQDIGAALLVAT